MRKLCVGGKILYRKLLGSKGRGDGGWGGGREGDRGWGILGNAFINKTYLKLIVLQ